MPSRLVLRVLAFASATLLLATATAAFAADSWTHPEPGISRLHRTVSGPLSIHAVVVDLCDPSLELRATRASESPRRTSGWGTLVGARAAINGDFYNTTNYHPIGLAMGAGEVWPGTSDGSGWALVAAGGDGVVEIRPAADALGSTPEPWMREIVGGNPNCLVDGVALSSSASHYGELHPRSGVGLSADGTKLVMVVIDGRWPAGSVGVTTRRLGEELASLGAWSGLNFDGGGSSTLWLAADGVLNRTSDGSERTVSNHLGVLRVEVPAGEPSRCCFPEAVPGATGTFEDVDASHWALEAIEALFEGGVTRGCSASPPYFCPDCRATRSSTVGFVMRASGRDLTPPAVATFSDVPVSHPLFAEIEAAAREGVTSGCGGGRFCPDQPAARAVMAIFAARAMGLAISPPSEPPFSDLPVEHSAAGAVRALVDACAVGGCGPDTFCPDRTATRAEVAVVTARAARMVPTPCDPGDPGDAGDAGDPADADAAADAGDRPDAGAPEGGSEPRDSDPTGPGAVLSSGCGCAAAGGSGAAGTALALTLALASLRLRSRARSRRSRPR